MSKYQVIVEPDGKFWCIRVPAVDRVTQAKGVDDIEPMASDLITIMSGEKNPQLDIEFLLPQQAKQHVEQMLKQRAIAREANARAAKESRLAAQSLREEGLTLRQIGQLLGVSYQRAFQLVHDDSPREAQSEQQRKRTQPIPA